jgi:hypothetical protein
MTGMELRANWLPTSSCEPLLTREMLRSNEGTPDLTLQRWPTSRPCADPRIVGLHEGKAMDSIPSSAAKFLFRDVQTADCEWDARIAH